MVKDAAVWASTFVDQAPPLSSPTAPTASATPVPTPAPGGGGGVGGGVGTSPVAAPVIVLPPVPASAFHSKWLDQSAYPALRPGDDADVLIHFVNTGGVSWERGVAGREVRLGVAGDDDTFQSMGMARNWPLPNRVAVQDELAVLPGAVGTFRFGVRAPMQTGAYRIPLRPVADGVTWLDDNGVFILVSSDWGYHSRWVGQSPYPVLHPGEVSGEIFVSFRNTGTRTWASGSPDQVNLGIAGDDVTFASLGMANGWLSANRVATARETAVAPGEVGTFAFRIRAPSATGRYILRLRPVADGTTWLEDDGVWLEVNVVP